MAKARRDLCKTPSFAQFLCQAQILHEVKLKLYLQNTKCIRASPVGPEDRTGWLKFSSFLNLNKIEHFSKASGHVNAVP